MGSGLLYRQIDNFEEHVGGTGLVDVEVDILVEKIFFVRGGDF